MFGSKVGLLTSVRISPVVGFEHDDGAVVLLHELLGERLQAPVDRQDHVVTLGLRHPRQHAQLAAERVDLDLLAARHAAQPPLPGLLGAELPDQVAHAVAGQAAELGLRDLARRSRSRCAPTGPYG